MGTVDPAERAHAKIKYCKVKYVFCLTAFASIILNCSSNHACQSLQDNKHINLAPENISHETGQLAFATPRDYKLIWQVSA